jgi:hypothetical protein
MKLKRVKKTIPIIKTKMIEHKDIEIVCPHCHTHLIGGYGEHTLRFLCSYCKQPIEIIWPNLEY